MNIKSNCSSLDLLVVDISLACVDGALAFIAFSQFTRIHLRNQHSGWTRQKVLHLMVASCNLGYFIYFISTVIATCDRWPCWSHACGFILMAFPKILFLAAFLLLLSFWVDLCHQANEEDDDEEENNSQQPLLESSKNKPGSMNTYNCWNCCSFRSIHVGGRQKFVITVAVLIFFLMLSFAVIIWVGTGENPIGSSVVARVYVDFFASAILILGVALGCYGLILFLKLRNVRSETASSEMRKVAGLAVVSVVCFTSSAAVALLTDVPLLYDWSMENKNEAKTLVLLVFYYFIGSSVPSAFVLWAMRELPAPVTITQAQSRSVTFFCYGAEGTQNPRHWVAATTSTNQVSDRETGAKHKSQATNLVHRLIRKSSIIKTTKVLSFSPVVLRMRKNILDSSSVLTILSFNAPNNYLGPRCRVVTCSAVACGEKYCVIKHHFIFQSTEQLPLLRG